MNLISLSSFSGAMLSVLAACSFGVVHKNTTHTKPILEVSVQAYQRVQGNNIVYSYKVANKSKAEIVSIAIGFDRDADQPELSIPPLGWNFSSGAKKGSISSPTGWRGRVVTQEESDKYWIEWEIRNPGNTGLLPEHNLEGLSVLVPKSDSAYNNGHFEVIFRDSTRTQGRIEYKGSL